MSEINSICEKQREFFKTGATLDVSFRIEALSKLKATITTNEAEILDALKKDLGKSSFEAYEAEVGLVLEELGYAISHVRRWAAPERVPAPLVHFKSICRILHEPYGVTLIMSPWNYPVQLTLAPLIGAIAGGNCAVVKPSAYSPASSAVITKILSQCFDPRHVAVIEGGRLENQALLQEKFDYIFFTGSVEVGKLVMQSASRNLTPVTLELGGKSPCIVCKDADIGLAARRIIWGKTLNAGQTCVAPDYLLVHKSVSKALIESMKKAIREFYGDNPLESEDLPRIVNEKHFYRVSGYLCCGEAVAGGQTDESRLKIAPTILCGVDKDSPVMREEIFGPLLPVLEFDDLNEVISEINGRPKPLALYLFTTGKEAEEAVLQKVSFGGGCVNDTIVHLATSAMPFGGVGESGMGGYHGKWGFETFTHSKSILKKALFPDVNLRYPPYKGKLELLKKLLH